MVRPPGLEPGTHGLKVRCSTTELRAHMVVFRTSEYFHAWLLYTPPTTPTLYANFALLLGNILETFFNVVAPIHDVEQVMGIEPT